MIKAIISGAQTGADRAGLDAAIQLCLGTGGCVPKGRRTEEGPLSDEVMQHYSLWEHLSSSAYDVRARINVEGSDGTVVFGNLNSAGSRLTLRLCRTLEKPVITNPTSNELAQWVDKMNIKVLNVAGNRESVTPGIYASTFNTIIEAFKE